MERVHCFCVVAQLSIWLGVLGTMSNVVWISRRLVHDVIITLKSMIVPLSIDQNPPILAWALLLLIEILPARILLRRIDTSMMTIIIGINRTGIYLRNGIHDPVDDLGVSQ
jgi:hypothetical protein